MYYRAVGWLKMWEQDDWNHGCDPSSGGVMTGDERFVADTPEELVHRLMAWVDCHEKENVLLDSCDEIGRVDIQVLETDNSERASESQLEAWKAGKLRLWLCTYTFHIEQVESQPAPLSGLDL